MAGATRPDVFAALGDPGNQTAISEAERRMGLKLPREMRQWLLMTDIDAGGPADVRSCPVALGCPGVLPGGGLLLGLTDVERVYRHKTAMEEAAPSGDPESPSWRTEWVPIAAELDGFYGTFLDARTGTVGSWTEGSSPEKDEYTSLSAFFQDVADQWEGVSSGDRSGPGGARRLDPRPEGEPVRLWARAHGCLVHDRGRVPAPVREAYAASPTRTDTA
ncbi:Lsr2 family DNA-binding protein [Streptomyces sp. YJ-C3]